MNLVKSKFNFPDGSLSLLSYSQNENKQKLSNFGQISFYWWPSKLPVLIVFGTGENIVLRLVVTAPIPAQLVRGRASVQSWEINGLDQIVIRIERAKRGISVRTQYYILYFYKYTSNMMCNVYIKRHVIFTFSFNFIYFLIPNTLN